MLNEPDWLNATVLIRRFYQRRVNQCAVDDLTQITLEKALQHSQDVRNAQSQSAWLYRIASNVLIDFYRKQINYTKNTEVFNEENYRIESVSSHEVADCIHCMIESLDKHDKQLLKIIDLESYSQKQLADERGLSYSGLKSQVQRARIKLKNNLLHCCEVAYDKQGWPIEIIKENSC